jgi:hypothetical protein
MRAAIGRKKHLHPTGATPSPRKMCESGPEIGSGDRQSCRSASRGQQFGRNGWTAQGRAAGARPSSHREQAGLRTGLSASRIGATKMSDGCRLSVVGGRFSEAEDGTENEKSSGFSRQPATTENRPHSVLRQPCQSTDIGSTSTIVRRLSSGREPSTVSNALRIMLRWEPLMNSCARCSPFNRPSGAGAGPRIL